MRGGEEESDGKERGEGEGVREGRWEGGLLLSCPSHNVLPLAGACHCPLCHSGQVVSRAGRV